MLSGSFGVFPLFLKRKCILLRCQAFSTASSHTNFNKHAHSSKKELLLEEEAAARSEAYRQLENLNFKSAAKILFTTPPKRKKFGLDFHLVQLFFACLPSLAVYLVAQYARSEIRRMEAEVEQRKKQAEEENKVRDTELEPTKEKSNNDLSEVKIRLSALEAALKEILDEKINVIHSDSSRNKKVRNGAIEPAGKNSKNQNEAKASTAINLLYTTDRDAYSLCHGRDLASATINLLCTTDSSSNCDLQVHQTQFMTI